MFRGGWQGTALCCRRHVLGCNERYCWRTPCPSLEHTLPARFVFTATAAKRHRLKRDAHTPARAHHAANALQPNCATRRPPNNSSPFSRTPARQDAHEAVPRTIAGLRTHTHRHTPLSTRAGHNAHALSQHGRRNPAPRTRNPGHPRGGGTAKQKRRKQRFEKLIF